MNQTSHAKLVAVAAGVLFGVIVAIPAASAQAPGSTGTPQAVPAGAPGGSGASAVEITLPVEGVAAPVYAPSAPPGLLSLLPAPLACLVTTGSAGFCVGIT